MQTTVERNLKDLRRYVEEAAAHLQQHCTPQEQPEEESRIVTIFRTLLQADADFTRITDFDELFLAPVLTQVVDVQGTLWVKLERCSAPLERGWAPITFGAPELSVIAGVSETLCAKGLGPLKHGPVLQIDGNILDVWCEQT